MSSYESESDVDGFTKTSSFSGLASLAGKGSTFFAELDALIRENDDSKTINSADDVFTGKSRKYSGIKKIHWKDGSQRQKCSACGKAFNFAARKFNCRRCGEIFCEHCCQFKKRLSSDAMPDPMGNFYRVCFKCADLNVQSVGQTRCLSSMFSEHRRNRRVNPLQELVRLVNGYKSNVKASKIHSSLRDTLSLVKVPEWQKADKWVDSAEVEWCGKCNVKFSLLKQKNHCRVCGSVFCRQCINNDLMLYFDDATGMANWSLIGFVGCPDNEPSICTYLSVCLMCHEEIEELQVQHHYAGDDVITSVSRLSDVAEVLQRLSKLRVKVESALSRYQELIDTMFVGQKSLNDISSSGQSIVQTFAKLQVDISDTFTQYFIVVQSLKEIPLGTKTDAKIMRNVLKEKCSYYNGQMVLFKGLKETLQKSLPSKALEEVQQYSNKQAINSAYIVSRQLGLEALHYASMHRLDAIAALKVSEVDQVCYEELRQYVQETGDDWACHDNALKDIIKERLKLNKLILPNEAKREQPGYMVWLLFNRTAAVLKQVLQALEAKSADTRFRSSKRTLVVSIEQLAIIAKSR